MSKPLELVLQQPYRAGKYMARIIFSPIDSFVPTHRFIGRTRRAGHNFIGLFTRTDEFADQLVEQDQHKKGDIEEMIEGLEHGIRDIDIVTHGIQRISADVVELLNMSGEERGEELTQRLKTGLYFLERFPLSRIQSAAGLPEDEFNLLRDALTPRTET